MNRLIIISVVIFLTGCAGANYALENYDGANYSFFYHNERKYGVIDHSLRNKMLIESYNLSGKTTKQTIIEVAKDYLNKSGRKCRVNNVEKAPELLWEVFYKC